MNFTKRKKKKNRIVFTVSIVHNMIGRIFRWNAQVFAFVSTENLLADLPHSVRITCVFYEFNLMAEWS